MNRTYISVIGAMIALSLPLSAFALDADIYYPLDDGIGRSAGEARAAVQPAQFSGELMGWASGKIGNAVAFGGADNAMLDLGTLPLSGGHGTLSLWFRLEALSDKNSLFGSRSTTDPNVYMALFIDHEGRPTIQWRDSATGNDRRAQGTTLIERNAWYNLVLRTEGLQWKMTVNGGDVPVLGENSGRWFTNFSNANLLYRAGSIGANPLPGGPNMYLDDIRLFSRMLTDAEVTALYNETNNATPTSPASPGTPAVTPTPPPAATPAVPVVDVPVSTTPPVVAPVGSSEWRASLLAQLAEILKLLQQIQAELNALRAQGIS